MTAIRKKMLGKAKISALKAGLKAAQGTLDSIKGIRV